MTKRILGVDPGFDRAGFGVIEDEGGSARWITHRCLQTSAGDSFSVRLKQLRDETARVIAEFRPQAVAVEQLFFQSNAKTAIKVGMARGVILLAIADAGLPLIEVTPNQVKQGIAGWGAADKRQLQAMVQRWLKLVEPPEPDDAADALAIAMVGARLYQQRM